jgi:hypothetical protein
MAFKKLAAICQSVTQGKLRTTEAPTRRMGWHKALNINTEYHKTVKNSWIQTQFWTKITSLMITFCGQWVAAFTRAYPKISGLSRKWNIRLQQQTLAEKLHERLWRQNSLELTHKVEIELQLVAESRTICSSRSRRPVRKYLNTPT